MDSRRSLGIGEQPAADTGAGSVGASSRPQPARIPIETQSGYLDFFPIVLRNTLAVWLTFNVYVFWAKTNARRYLWQTTLIDGDALRYKGSGKRTQPARSTPRRTRSTIRVELLLRTP